jgi:hypothetical protein
MCTSSEGDSVIRKQIYLTEAQNERLQQLAEQRGVTQAEVTREGFEQYLVTLENKDQEWKELFALMKNMQGSHLTMSRDEIYRERLERLEDKRDGNHH